MNNFTKIAAGLFAIMIFVTVQAQAQWETVKAGFTESDLIRISGQSYSNYKGLNGGAFEIMASVEVRKDKGKVNFLLHTKSINMDKYYAYSYRPGPKLKYCMPGQNGKLEEREKSSASFSAGEIGEAPFEQLKRSAYATFDVEITFIVKDNRYGISGFGAEKGWGYRVNRIFKNVKANGVFWAEDPLETNYPIEELKILNNPRLVSFKADDSQMHAAIQNFIKEWNEKNEAQCRSDDKKREADKLKKEAEAREAEAAAKEIENMKNKLQSQVNITGGTAKTENAKEDDFWSGHTNRNTSTGAKTDEDFWAGREEKSAGNDDFWSGGRYTHINIEESPDNFKTDKGFYTIRGQVESSENTFNAFVSGEDYEHPVIISNNRFQIHLLLKSGINRFKLNVNNEIKNIEVMCNRKPVKLRASLIWDKNGSDIDLHMINPKGYVCYYQRKTVGNMMLDVDNTKGYGPENIYVDGVEKGDYIIKVKNYSNGIGSKCTVYIYIDEKLHQTKSVFFSRNNEVIEVSKIQF